MGCCGKPPVQPYVVPFAGFTEFVASIPKLYWGVKSQEQRILAICEQLNKLICFVDYQGGKINLNRVDIDWLMEQFELFKQSGFDDYYLEQVQRWIDEHLQYIYRYTIGQIFFSLDDEGYLIAHVPVGWEQIRFSTPLDYSDQSTYGRLCLTYAFDAELEG